MTEPEYRLPESLGNALMAYLQTKPFQEVARFVDSLQRLQPVETLAAVPDTEPKAPPETSSKTG